MSLLTDLALFLALLYLVQNIVRWLVHKRRSLSTFASLSIPGPDPNFWTGSGRDYIRGYHATLDRWAREYGPRYGFYMGEKPILVLSDVDDVLEVVTKLGRHFPNREKGAIQVQPFASSLLAVRGDHWRQSRRTLTPPFTAHKIAHQNNRHLVNTCVHRLLNELDKTSSRVDLNRYMKSATLDIISRLAFSMDDTDVYEEDSHLRKITAAMMENTDNLVITLSTYLPFIKRVIVVMYEAVGKKTMKLLKHVEGCVENYYRKKEANNNKEDSKTKTNILDFMLEQKELGNLTELEVMGNALTILVAGYDTTATGLTFTLYLLAKHQDIQSKLRQEILATLETCEEAFSEDTVPNYSQFDENRCELLDRVWFESLRLYPPVVTFITRELDDSIEQVVLTKTGLPITGEMTIQVPVWTIHHNPDYWPRPYEFDPYRDNLPIPGATKQNGAFFAFGAGPRNCIGNQLAVSEARALISGILRRYKLELASEEEIDSETGLLKLVCYSTVIIHPTKDVYLKLTPIN